MPSRSKDGYTTLLDEYTASIYVICPSCKKQAIVEALQTNPRTAKLTCTNCGFNKAANTSRFFSGVVIDPYFGLPLWLTTPCGANQLWAYNYVHLAFLRTHVEAKLRERNGLDMRNQSLGSRLPKWMLTRKHRDNVLRSIIRLEKIRQTT